MLKAIFPIKNLLYIICSVISKLYGESLFNLKFIDCLLNKITAYCVEPYGSLVKIKKINCFYL